MERFEVDKRKWYDLVDVTDVMERFEKHAPYCQYL